MPDFYEEGEYDVAGFAVGSVKKDMLIDGSKIEEGDALIGLESSGIHSNGYSLVRKIIQVIINLIDNNLNYLSFVKKTGINLNDRVPWDLDKTYSEIFLEPTKIYVKQILNLHETINIKVN